MLYTFSEWVFMFAIYGVAGWICETIYCSIKHKRYVNRGFLRLPLLPIYGLGSILVYLATQPFRAYPVLVFLVSFVVCTGLEYFSSWFMETLYQMRWWDYSRQKFQIKGRVSLLSSLAFGALGVVMIYGLQPWVEQFMALFSTVTLRTIAGGIAALVLIDLLRSSAAVTSLREALHAPDEAEGESRRLLRANPNIQSAEFNEQMETLKERIAAQEQTRREHWDSWLSARRAEKTADKAAAKLAWKEITFSRMVWLFLVGSVMGTVVEMVFCMFTTGTLMSRQGVIYGPFSQIYGIGAVLIVMLATPLLRKGDKWLFVGGALFGGVYEAIAGLIQEQLLGSKSWDYSDYPFAFFGGRTNLLYMIFWGILVVVFMRKIYPPVVAVIDRIPPKAQRALAWGFTIFMIWNLAVSGLAVNRWSARIQNVPAQNQIEEWLDVRYPDDFLREIYPHMMFEE